MHAGLFRCFGTGGQTASAKIKQIITAGLVISILLSGISHSCASGRGCAGPVWQRKSRRSNCKHESRLFYWLEQLFFFFFFKSTLLAKYNNHQMTDLSLKSFILWTLLLKIIITPLPTHKKQVKDLRDWVNNWQSSQWFSFRLWITSSSEYCSEWCSGRPQSSLNPPLTGASFWNNILPWLLVTLEVMNFEKNWQHFGLSCRKNWHYLETENDLMEEWGVTEKLLKNTAAAFQKRPRAKETRLCRIAFIIFFFFFCCCCHNFLHRRKNC